MSVTALDEVARVMRRDPQTIEAVKSVKNAIARMSETNIRHLVVVLADGTPCGVLSQRDLFRFLAFGGHERAALLTVMMEPIVIGTPEMSLKEAARLMRKERIGCLPILSPSKKLIGIVTRSDVLECLI